MTSHRLFTPLFATLASLCLLADPVGSVGVVSAPLVPQVPPVTLDLSANSFHIVSASFVSSLNGTDTTYHETNPSQYRAVVVTIKIDKPSNEPLDIFAQDLTLHYTHGKTNDVAKCQGVSSFSQHVYDYRPMNIYDAGYGDMQTDSGTTKATEIYVDLFFEDMEPDTSSINLEVAQPTGASYATNGWTQ